MIRLAVLRPFISLRHNLFVQDDLSYIIMR
jgi:hypothetical protein